jgi:hypothetical protein
MEFAYTLSGGAPVIKKYMAGTTMATAGIPLLGAVDAATDLGSVEPMAASTAVNQGSQVGLLLDTSGTVAATGITDSDELMVSVIINPDAVIRARANNGTASGTALATTSATAADTTGATITGATTFDNGAVWGYSGNNVGEFRRCDDTAGSLSINLPNGILTSDVYIAVHGFPCSVELTNWECYDLTTDLTEIIAQTAVTDMDNFATVDLEMNDTTDDGTNNSYYHLIANNHLFGSSSIA